MKRHIVLKAMLVAALLGTAMTASAALVMFQKKEATSAGEKYFYKYTCTSGSTGSISVIATDDAKAKLLAEQKGKVVCEET